MLGVVPSNIAIDSSENEERSNEERRAGNSCAADERSFGGAADEQQRISSFLLLFKDTKDGNRSLTLQEGTEQHFLIDLQTSSLPLQSPVTRKPNSASSSSVVMAW